MTPSPRRVRTRAVGLVAGALLTMLPLTGCGMLGSGSGGSGGSGSGSGSSDGAPVKLNADGTVPKPLSTITRTIKDFDITIDVAQMARVNQVTRLQFTVTPRSRGTSSVMPGNFFGSALDYDVSNVYLLDTVNLKRYPVLTANGEDCICSNRLSNFTLDRPTLLFADFPLVPQDVKRISVVIPAVGPLPATELS